MHFSAFQTSNEQLINTVFPKNNCKIFTLYFLSKGSENTMDEKMGVILLVEDELKDLLDKEFEIDTNDFDFIDIDVTYEQAINILKSLRNIIKIRLIYTKQPLCIK